ncbi:MAG: heavy metal-binding domain-containing protein [Desulfosarcinaceae bacterium]|nr:heavy metal-binding domain-containing protein [Desulfosarcinaceae bacterium]
MIDLIIFLSLVALGFGAGTFVEKRHYRRIRTREAATIHLPITTTKQVDCLPETVQSVELVQGSAVISVDYFKRLLASLRNLFGGNVKSYESLIDRARREALLRMKEKAPQAHMIVNVRIETATVGRKANKKGVGCLEALAYGTAVTLKESA